MIYVHIQTYFDLLMIRQLSDYANSKRELFLCEQNNRYCMKQINLMPSLTNIGRDLRCKIHGGDSLAVSHCDLMLGQINASVGNRAEAYVAFYRLQHSKIPLPLPVLLSLPLSALNYNVGAIDLD